MFDSFFIDNKFSLKKIITSLSFIVFCYYGLNVIDAKYPYPLFYHFRYAASLFMIMVLSIYGIINFPQQWTRDIVYAIFITFHVTFLHALFVYCGSLFVDSASVFVHMETTIYFLFPLLEILILVLECFFIKKYNKIHDSLSWINQIILSTLMIIEIIIMDYLGYIYLFLSYKSIYMLLNVIMMIVVCILMGMFTILIKKYQQLKISQKLYLETIEYQRNFENMFKRQYESLNKWNHDFKYYLNEIKSVMIQNDNKEIENMFDRFHQKLEENQIVFTNETLMNMLLMKKKEEAMQNNIKFDFVIVGKKPGFMHEHDLYYLFYTILDILLKLELESLSMRVQYDENIVIKIKTENIEKKIQEKILHYIKPILDQYNGYAQFMNHNEFIATLYA